jgi:hypothetical protein
MTETNRFVNLTVEDCVYLLELIQEMDMETAYTAKQRAYTIPKLQQIAKDSRSRKLALQDVEYLLELIEDDDLEEIEQQREMTRATLLEIQALMNQRQEMMRDINSQREQRRGRRRPATLQDLEEKFNS